jgi:hypothetical protein
MNLYVDHRGKIDILALTPREHELVGKNTDIQVFVKGMAKKVEKLLAIDRSPESNLVALLLGKKMENYQVTSHELYKSEEGYHIIWQPWDQPMDTTGYDSVITINPPYSDVERNDDSL